MKKIVLWIGSCLASAWICATPQAVIFDFGGVMHTDPNRKIMDQFIQDSLRISKKEVKAMGEEVCYAFKGGVSDEQFWVDYAQKNHIKLPPNWSQSFQVNMKNALGVNPQMYAIVDALKKENMIVGMLSNVGECKAKRIADVGLYEPFTPCILSWEVGVKKPNPKIYDILIAQLDLLPDQIVFIDNKRVNIEAAKNKGIDAILFRSADQVRHELIQRGLLK